VKITNHQLRKIVWETTQDKDEEDEEDIDEEDIFSKRGSIRAHVHSTPISDIKESETMPYSKPKKRKCRKADGSSGSWVVDKELSSGKTEQSSCHDSEDKASASIRARKANEIDVPYGEEINEDIARILVKDFSVPVVEQAGLAYDPACQYEVDVNRRLDTAGVRSPFTPPSEHNFCIKTDTAGGDAEFNALDFDGNLATYNLELKAGSGKKRGENPGFSHPAGQDLLNGLSGFNNLQHISNIVTNDIARKTGNGIIVIGDYDEILPESIEKISKYIVDMQAASISSHLGAATPPKLKLLRVYYYFGRTGRAEKELDIPKSFNLSKPDSSLVGTFEESYSKSNTNYIQIENAGMFYMIKDPLNLASIGVRNFSGNMKTSARFRVETAGGKKYHWDDLNINAVKDGNPVTVSCQIRTKDYYIYVNEDLNVSSKTRSGLDLDVPADLQKFVDYVKKPAVPPAPVAAASVLPAQSLEPELNAESIAKVFLKEALLLETQGDAYELALVKAINAAMTSSDVSAAKNKPLHWDLNISVGGATASVEVKLGKEDQLGKVAKASWEQNAGNILEYTVGSGFTKSEPKALGQRGPWKQPMTPDNVFMAKLAVEQLSTPEILETIDDLFKNMGVPVGTPLNMRKSLQSMLEGLGISTDKVPLSEDQKKVKAIEMLENNNPEKLPQGFFEGRAEHKLSTEELGKIRKIANSKTKNPIIRPSDAKIKKRKQINVISAIAEVLGTPVDLSPSGMQFSGSKDFSAIIPKALIKTKMEKTNYLIMGDGSPGVSGWIGATNDQDVLGLELGRVEFPNADIEARFISKSKIGKPPKHSFSFETRAAGDIVMPAKGRFNSPEELIAILLSSSLLQAQTPVQQVQPPVIPQIQQRSATNSGLERVIKNIVSEITEDCVAESDARLIVEELTGADKSDIKRMIAKEIDSAANKKATRKIFLAEFDREFKKMIDSKPLKDSIRSGVESAIKDKATKKEIAEVTKAVIKKLYRELSYSSVHIVDRIKI